MKNGGQSNIELPAECKEPKLPTIMVSFNGIHLALEEENQIKAKKQVKFSKESSENTKPALNKKFKKTSGARTDTCSRDDICLHRRNVTCK